MKKSKADKTKAVSRRDFIKGLGGGSIGMAIAPKLQAQDTSPIKTNAGNIPAFSKKKINVFVNGRSVSLVVEPRDTLLYTLREQLNLTGAKRTCDRGECGGCTILLDGEPIYSCMFLTFRADGKEITTIEGLAQGQKLHPIQRAFIDKDAYQCGFCTPGFILSSSALLKEKTDPTDDDIKQGLSGNLCRCGNYTKIYEAIETVAKSKRRS